MEGLDTTAALDSTRRGRHEFSLGPGGGCQNLRLHDEMVAVSHDVHVVEIDGGGREGLPAPSAYGSRCAAREAREVIDPTRTLPFAFALRAESSKCSLVSRLVGRRRCHPAISRPQLPTQPRLIITNPPPLKNARTSTRQQHSAALRARRLDSPAQTAPPHIHSPSRCARTKIGPCRPEQCQKELCGGDWRRAPPQLTCKQAPRGAVIRSQLRRRPPLVRSEAPPPLTNSAALYKWRP